MRRRSNFLISIFFTLLYELVIRIIAVFRPKAANFVYPDDIARIQGDLIREALLSVEEGKILDLGAALTTAVPYIASENVSVYRCDIDKEALETGEFYLKYNLRSDNPDNYTSREADAYDLPFDDRFFDLIVLSAVLDEGKGQGEDLDFDYIDYKESDIERVLSEKGDLILASSTIRNENEDDYLDKVGLERSKFDEVVCDGGVIWLKGFNGS